MSEYISREAFKEEVRRLSTHYLNEWSTLGVLAAVDRIPAADVREVKRGHKVTHNRPIAGHWVSGKLDGGWDGMEGRVWVKPIENNPVDYCSECGKRLDDTFQNFCPNCGADMRGADDAS